MAEKRGYPQIPSTVWWGVRGILKRTPTATIDERLLGVQLNVQEVAARAYVGELRAVGILSEDNKATPVAHKWRLDDTYVDAVDEIVRSAYPQGLIDLAPPGEAERQKVVSWFQRDGLGLGTAGNKAATYLTICSLVPLDTVRVGKGTPEQSSTRAAPKSPKRGNVVGAVIKPASSATSDPPGADHSPKSSADREAFPLNVNVQIHISADAGTDQIESIFQAMRRYLYNVPHT